tara:strand:- start:5541 stop:8387 length:2847 start_codon:yes stop_codon:yes gene_type:complete
MIFSRIFTPSHQSSKPEKRMQAIQTLSPDKAQEKTILHELAFNDDNADVSIAALDKLNSFVLWLKMSQLAKNARLKKVAEGRVYDALIGKGALQLSSKEKVSFLTETASLEILSEWVPKILEHDSLLSSDESVLSALIEKINKPSFTQWVILNVGNKDFNLKLVNEETNAAFLTKLAKKVTEHSLAESIATRIEAIKQLQQQPIELKKQFTLCLSKYQALLEKSDIGLLEQKQQAYEKELTLLHERGAILSAAERAEFDQKHQRIAEQVSRYVERLRPHWQAEQKAAELSTTKALCEQQLVNATEQVNWLFNERLCEATLNDVAMANETVRELEATCERLLSLTDDKLAKQAIDGVSTAINALNKKLDDFSAQQQFGQKLSLGVEALEKASHAIVEASEQDDGEPDANLWDAFESAKAQYNRVCAELLVVPKDLKRRFKSAVDRVSEVARARKAKSQALIKQFRKNINVVDRLIEQGKFRLALSKFAKLSESYEQLSDVEKQAMAKRYEQTKGSVERLEGWQTYLAAPRKPALIEEANALSQENATNIKQRSDAIKVLRKQWQSLTSVSLNDENDIALQKQFDDALERAFEPCREHYAMLDAQRKEAIDSRKSVIEFVRKLDTEQPMIELAKAFDRATKKWHSAGHVDKEHYASLKQDWKSVSLPIQKKINHWQMENQRRKRELIDQANALKTTDDIASAAAQAQELQSKWKEVGHAGKREESQLWNAFKRANDDVFSRLKLERNERNKATSDSVERLIDTVKAISPDEEHGNYEAKIDDVKSQLEALPKPLHKKVEREIARLESRRYELKSNTEKRSLRERVDALSRIILSCDDNIVDESQRLKDVLGRRWANAIAQATAPSQHGYDRHWLTVALEASVDLPSPSSDTSIRSSVQLQMMTAKLEKGEALAPDELLFQWLTVDTLDTIEDSFARRVVAVIEKYPEVVA